jgi:hypothetical protein
MGLARVRHDVTQESAGLALDRWLRQVLHVHRLVGGAASPWSGGGGAFF